MNRESRAFAYSFGWSIVLMAAALALSLCLLTRCAHGGPQSLEDYAQQAIRRLPVFYEDNPPGGVAGRTDAKEAQLTVIAHEVALVSASARKPPLPPRQWVALLLTIGFHESTFSLRIHAGQCRPHECDRGRARGVFQGHQNLANRAYWPRMQGIENTAVQVWAADQLLRRSVSTCTPPGLNPSNYIKGIFDAYGGRRCSGEWGGAEERYATFRRLRP